MSMSPNDWVSFGQWAVAAGIGVLLWFLSVGRMAGRLEQRLQEVERRLERAGKQMSDLTDKIQVLPNQDTIKVVWRELNRIETDQKDIERTVADLSRRVATVEGERFRRKVHE